MRVASTCSRPCIHDYPELFICFEFTVREPVKQRQRHKFAYLFILFISLPSSAKQQREIAKFEVL